MEDEKVIIYCDGGSRGNPGLAASAFVVVKGDKVIFKNSKFLGRNTNNFAEYTSVLMAVEWLYKQSLIQKGSIVIINLDSQLVERQLNGIYKIKNSNLIGLFNKINLILQRLEFKILIKWNYRNENRLADLLVNETLDKFLQRSKNSSTGKQ